MRSIKILGLTFVLSIFGAVSSFAQGWNQQDGRWTYEKADGALAIQEWIQDNGYWYYMDDQNAMVTGWHQDPAQNWYYLKGDGAMAVQEWVEESGQDYYLNGSGIWETDAQSDQHGGDSGEIEYYPVVEDTPPLDL